jgi:hypothetical protein
LQVSRAADPETLQSQLAKTARKRLSLSGLELLHGRLPFCLDGDALGTERPNRTDHGSPFTLSALAERKG